MTYSETLQFIYNRLPLFQVVGSSAYKVGLDSMEKFDARLGNPHHSFKTIHIGGTNGKGSVSHSIASILQSAGYKVGLFTSPHLKDFRERIRVNGEVISEKFVIDFVEEHKQFFDEVYPSFFEVCVAMAFDYFRAEKVDVAIIEVGLGGRLDSTNIIQPLLSIVTNVSYDHQDILGHTIPEIAKEKAGIMKPGIPFIIGDDSDEVCSIMKMVAQSTPTSIFEARNLPIQYVRNEIGNDGIERQLFLIENELIATPLLGEYQKQNMRTVRSAISLLRLLGFSISEEAMLRGFSKVIEQTQLLGRWQQLNASPKVICDTGHNVAGIQHIVHQLSNLKYNKLRIVFGMVGDKDVSAVLALLPQDAIYYFTKAQGKRALSEFKLSELAAQYGLKGECFDNVALAYQTAIKDASPEDVIYVGGSTYVVAEIL